MTSISLALLFLFRRFLAPSIFPFYRTLRCSSLCLARFPADECRKMRQVVKYYVMYCRSIALNGWSSPTQADMQAWSMLDSLQPQLVVDEPKRAVKFAHVTEDTCSPFQPVDADVCLSENKKWHYSLSRCRWGPTATKLRPVHFKIDESQLSVTLDCRLKVPQLSIGQCCTGLFHRFNHACGWLKALTIIA